jgi:uncharacterized protein Veg
MKNKRNFEAQLAKRRGGREREREREGEMERGNQIYSHVGGGLSGRGSPMMVQNRESSPKVTNNCSMYSYCYMDIICKSTIIIMFSVGSDEHERQ